MARKAKNKKQQTFNVYPYLGGYQHFMKGGANLPSYEDKGETPETQQEKMQRLYKQQFGDRSKYSTLGGMGRIGMLGNVIQGVGEGINNTKEALSKSSYDAGGKYSKYDANGGLRYGNVSYTNTTDENAMLHGDNLQKYIGMSKKEKKEWVESGGRNDDLWWSTDDMTFGKRNFMDRNEDGLAKWDGSNFRVVQERNRMSIDPVTGESLFTDKQKNKDGTFTHFNKDGTVNYNKSNATQYDNIEEGYGAGGLADVNAGIMNFDFDAKGDNKLVSFNQNTNRTTRKINADGEMEVSEEKINGTTPYDPTSYYGPTEVTDVSEESRQNRLNREAEQRENCANGNCNPPEESGGDQTLKYGAELRGMLTRYDVGGGDSADGYDTGYFDHDRYEVPFYEHGGPHNEDETNYPGQMQLPSNDPMDDFTPPSGNFSDDPYGPQFSTSGPSFDEAVNSPDNSARLNFDGRGMDIQAEPEEIANFERPNFGARLKNFFEGNNDLNKPPTHAKVMSDEMMEGMDQKVDPNAPRVLDPTSQNDMQGVATEEQKDMGIDINYGDTPLQQFNNRKNEFFNTGPVGAVVDGVSEASEFVVDKLTPLLTDFAEGQDRHEAKLSKQGVSAETFSPMMEETAGTGNRGFYDVNKGGYGDDLYGTGDIYGAAAHGKELMNQQPDLSGIEEYMNPSFEALMYNKEHLDKQKSFLGEMQTGGQLPKYPTGGPLDKLSKGRKLFNYVNPFAFKVTDNSLFSAGSRTEPFTNINFNRTNLDNKDLNMGFLNMNYGNNGPGVEMVSVMEDYKKMGIGTALYDKAVQKATENYPGLISGETLKNPEATINIWSNFNKEIQNTDRTRMDKIRGKNQFVDAGDTDFNSLIVDGKYTGPPVRLTGLNKKGETKISEFRSFYDELSTEDKMMYQMSAKGVGGFKQDIHSPLVRSVMNGFRTKKVIGDGKTFLEYNKQPLYLAGGLGAYSLMSGDNLDAKEEEKFKTNYLNKRAIEEGFQNAEEYLKHLNDTNTTMDVDGSKYEEYRNNVKDLYKGGGQPGFWANVHAKRARGESPDKSKVSAKTAKRFNLQNGGGTGSEGSVLRDKYGNPISMKHGGQHEMETASIYDMPNKDGAYDDQSWFTKANHGFSENMYNTSQKTNSLAAPAFGGLGKAVKTGQILDYGKQAYEGITNWMNDTPDTKLAGPPEGTSSMNMAKYGGEEEVEIDMDLYYELMKAGADVKILG